MNRDKAIKSCEPTKISVSQIRPINTNKIETIDDVITLCNNTIHKNNNIKKIKIKRILIKYLEDKYTDN